VKSFCVFQNPAMEESKTSKKNDADIKALLLKKIHLRLCHYTLKDTKFNNEGAVLVKIVPL